MYRGYYILIAIQVVLIALVIFAAGRPWGSFAPLHHLKFPLLVSGLLLVLSILFFIRPFQPERLLYAFMAAAMNLIVLGYIWYLWCVNQLLRVN